MLGDARLVETLKHKVDISFPASNPKYVGVEDEVKLEVDIKNVSSLIVKVFEIDTTGYYRIHKSEIPLGISLNGLVAKTETMHSFTNPPIISVRKSFAFPELNRRGVFVIEVISPVFPHLC